MHRPRRAATKGLLTVALALGAGSSTELVAAAPVPPEPVARGVLLVRDGGDLRVVTRDGTAMRRYDLGSEGLVAGVRGGAVASDGRIAFIGNRRQGPKLSDDGLFLISRGGVESIERPGAGMDWSTTPVWSPDDSFLAYRKGPAETWVADLRDGAVRVVQVDAPLVGGPVFTPDGQALVADVDAPSSPGHYNERQLVRVPIGGGPPQPLTPPSEVQALHPRFSPDGTRIAFLSLAQGGPGLWIGPVGGAPQRIAAAPAGHEDVEGLAWSPDGRWIAVLWGRRRAIRPGGALVDGTLEIIRADGGERHVARRGAAASYDRLTWSPDSRYVGFEVGERGAGGAAVASTHGKVRRAGLSRFDAPAWLHSVPPALPRRRSCEDRRENQRASIDFMLHDLVYATDPNGSPVPGGPRRNDFVRFGKLTLKAATCEERRGRWALIRPVAVSPAQSEGLTVTESGSQRTFAPRPAQDPLYGWGVEVQRGPDRFVVDVKLMRCTSHLTWWGAANKILSIPLPLKTGASWVVYAVNEGITAAAPAEDVDCEDIGRQRLRLDARCGGRLRVRAGNDVDWSTTSSFGSQATRRLSVARPRIKQPRCPRR